VKRLLSSLFPDPQQPPTPQQTMMVGLGDDESPPDADRDDWSLPVSDEKDKADAPADVEWARPAHTDLEILAEPETVAAVPMLSGAAIPPQFERDVPVLPVAGGNEARLRESDTDKLPRQWMGWASKGLLMWTLILGSFVAGMQFFGANSPVPPVEPQEPSEANAGDPAKAVDSPPPLVPISNAKQHEDHLKSAEQKGQPAAPVKVAPVAAAKPKSTPSLYARVRQIVRENRTEETERLGIGDVAYQNVADDGSIMVGMEVTYAPFFTHQVIKSVRPIYQKPDDTRYDGSVCGKPTQVGERIAAKEGYAIGGAAIKGGMGIDAMQLTFMEIGADGLNRNKSYLSKWLGENGGAGAKSYLNDGRPIVGIAGMWSKNANSPAFCLCLVTTKAGTLAAAGGQQMRQTHQQIIQWHQQQIMREQQ
jgi:hypothetical protein